MSDLTKNKAANALVWAAFFAFWLHSLHCCRAHAASERCVFKLTSVLPINDSPTPVCNAFCYPNRFSVCRRFPLRAASRFERPESSETPSFGRDRDVQKSTCSGACPPSSVLPEKKVFADSDLLSNRALADLWTNDVRLVSVSAPLTRFAAAFSTPLYLRLRKLLN